MNDYDDDELDCIPVIWEQVSTVVLVEKEVKEPVWKTSESFAAFFRKNVVRVEE